MNRYTKRLEALEHFLMERKRAERMKELESKCIGTDQPGRLCGVCIQHAPIIGGKSLPLRKSDRDCGGDD